jgi:pyruvate-formate lyase
MKAGRITRDKALELVECLFLKIQEVGAALEWPPTFTAKSGSGIFYTANICGTTPEGRDASNDLSCVMMEALANIRTNQPPIAVRYHRNMSPDVVERAIDLERVGMGHPSWFNEDLLEKWALIRGWSPEDAKRSEVGGCVSNVIKGTPQGITGNTGIGALICPMILNEVLLQSDMTKTKDPRDMQSADELLDACSERITFYSKLGIVCWNIAEQIAMEYFPDPLNSLLLDEPLERGIDAKKVQRGYDTLPHTYPLGEVSVANSLAAIQKLVFDDKKYTMEGLLNVLSANWEGYEEMRQDFLNAPKFGNDDDVADEWAVKVKTRVNETTRQFKDAWGYPMIIDGSTAAGYQMAGLPCGASPDGRRAAEFLPDGSRSPAAGSDTKGPTAVLNSVGKIPFMHTELFNQRIMPVFLEGENKKLFAQYLREWYEKGTIPHIQFNVVDSKVLHEAQEHPEDYTNLQVRVAGYSAFWIDLPKETQDSIIARSEQSFS